MSFLGDALGFELFHAKDLWKRLKKDPKRLILGVDPASTKVWNTVLNRDDEPLVDQMGGAYDGNWLSLSGDGGVYKRARENGIDTGAGLSMQRLAHAVAAIYAGNAFGGLGGGAGGSAGGAGSSAGPWASGYVFPAGSEFAGGTAGSSIGGVSAGSVGSGYSMFGPYASGYQFPASGGAFSAYGSAAPVGASGSASMFDFASKDWTDPNTYMEMQRYMPDQQQPQQPQQQRYDSAADAIARLQMQQREEMQRQEDEAQRAYLEQQGRLAEERAQILEAVRRMYA
jgi:hypothetical protein